MPLYAYFNNYVAAAFTAFSAGLLPPLRQAAGCTQASL